MNFTPTYFLCESRRDRNPGAREWNVYAFEGEASFRSMMESSIGSSLEDAHHIDDLTDRYAECCGLDVRVYTSLSDLRGAANSSLSLPFFRAVEDFLLSYSDTSDQIIQ